MAQPSTSFLGVDARFSVCSACFSFVLLFWFHLGSPGHVRRDALARFGRHPQGYQGEIEAFGVEKNVLGAAIVGQLSLVSCCTRLARIDCYSNPPPLCLNVFLYEAVRPRQLDRYFADTGTVCNAKTKRCCALWAFSVLVASGVWPCLRCVWPCLRPCPKSLVRSTKPKVQSSLLHRGTSVYGSTLLTTTHDS